MNLSFYTKNSPSSFRVVRMAERSKAPDSRIYPSHDSWDRAFWSPNGGVGSNPTSDIYPSFFFYFSLCNQFSTLFSCQNFIVKTCTLYITCKKKKKGTEKINCLRIMQTMFWPFFFLGASESTRLTELIIWTKFDGCPLPYYTLFRYDNSLHIRVSTSTLFPQIISNIHIFNPSLNITDSLFFVRTFFIRTLRLRDKAFLFSSVPGFGNRNLT